MSSFLDYNGLSLYDRNVKKRNRDIYYSKDEVDNLMAGLENDVEWKDAVATYNDIATTYPYPATGWTVTVLDTGDTYRYDGGQWVRIFANTIPKASATNDGLMSKEMYSTVSGYGTAATRNYTTAVDNSSNLPTAQAVNVYVTDSLTHLGDTLQGEIDEKVSTDDVGSAAGANYENEIPDEREYIEVKGDWYCANSKSKFELFGTGINGGIDLSFIEEMNNYTLHFNLANYSNAVTPLLHISGTINGEQVDNYYPEGSVLSYADIPDEYKADTDSATLEITVENYVEGTIIPLNLLIFPVLRDELNETDITLIDTNAYVNGYLIYYIEIDNVEYKVIGTYGLYSSSNLPTSSAVSALVRAVRQSLQSLIDGKVDIVEGKGLSTNDYTTEEKDKLASIDQGAEPNVQANWNESSAESDSYIQNKPTRLSQFINDSGFINATTNNLVNYYLKTETYTKEEINNLVSTIPHFGIEIVEELPTTDISSSTIYLLRTGTEQGDVYTEYIYVNNAWEKLGSFNIDLGNYYTKDEVDDLIPRDVSELNNDAGYLTSETISGDIVTGIKGESDLNYSTGNVTVTKRMIGLSAVENKSSATIRGELTSSNVITALGYTPMDSSTISQGDPNKVWSTNSLGVAGWNDASGGGSVTGVKGGNESTYRTGNVSLSASNVGAIDSSEKGSANGVAELDANGKIPNSRMPFSYSSAVSCAVGDISVTITDSNILSSSIIEPFSSNVSGAVINYTNILATAGTVTITFEKALEESASIKIRITNI